MTGDALRPREYCELSKLSAGGRRRVSHKAHGTISWMHERLWDAMIEADPEPDEFEQVLWEYALAQGSANGPARALASEIIADWGWACASPVYTAWLRGLRDKTGEGRRHGVDRGA